MTTRLLSLAAVGFLCLAVAACGSDESDGPGIDAKCDAGAVEEEIGHIVGESTLTFGGLRSLQCSGDWSYAVAVVGEGSDTSSTSVTLSPFLFLKTDDVLVLKSPQVVCGEGGPVPADLAALVCP